MRLLKMSVSEESDVVHARQRARHIAELLGFNRLDQVRIATAVSEIVRNAFRYSTGGNVEFNVETGPPFALAITVTDSGPGIANLQEILDGRFSSTTGMGMGILGTMRLMDECQIETGSGTAVKLKKYLANAGADQHSLRSEEIVMALGAWRMSDPLAEIQHQNQELIQTLAELRGREDELLKLARELEDTNRGVVALYAELDEKAERLKRAGEMKSRFISNMSHEFRTPLGSIRALSQLLLDRIDGSLTAEQEKQVKFIRKATDDLIELVNDLLDLAKIEAGKIEIKIGEFSVQKLFDALQDTLRHLVSDAVELTFEVVPGLETLLGDEAKISHVLRNLISNALKYTAAGTVHVRVDSVDREGFDAAVFIVTDTGIGIAENDLQRIFDEFTQIENPLQQRVHGSGLGLPLCRRLAEVLGGSIDVRSTLGHGSSFALVLPGARRDAGRSLQPANVPVLIVGDHASTCLLYESYLLNTRYRVCLAQNVDEARASLQRHGPRAIVLDLMRGDDVEVAWLRELKNGHESHIPVIVVGDGAEQHRGLAADADRYYIRYIKPLGCEELVNALDQLVGSETIREIGVQRTISDAGMTKSQVNH